jgi:hypothetical protein
MNRAGPLQCGFYVRADILPAYTVFNLGHCHHYRRLLARAAQQQRPIGLLQILRQRL